MALILVHFQTRFTDAVGSLFAPAEELLNPGGKRERRLQETQGHFSLGCSHAPCTTSQPWCSCRGLPHGRQVAPGQRLGHGTSPVALQMLRWPAQSPRHGWSCAGLHDAANSRAVI